MIQIRRNCSSSIRDSPDNHKITFGDFTITFSYDEYLVFLQLKEELGLEPLDCLDEILYAGVETLLDEIADRKQ